jgi:hypothetical protein
MRRLAAYAFLCSSLLRPSTVLCIEPTGDVRVEYGTCCLAESSSQPMTIAGEAAGDCSDCRDVAISAPSLSAGRLHIDAPLASSAAANVDPALGIAARTSAFAGPIGRGPGHHRLLSTTVIRR